MSLACRAIVDKNQPRVGQRESAKRRHYFTAEAAGSIDPYNAALLANCHD